MAGRLEGTHAFLRNHRPEARAHRRFLNQIDLTTEQRGEPPTQFLQLAEMVEPPGREACSGRIAKSTSDASLASQRASEPNRVIVSTPCARSSASCARRTANSAARDPGWSVMFPDLTETRPECEDRYRACRHHRRLIAARGGGALGITGQISLRAISHGVCRGAEIVRIRELRRR
jgi:hypothetical protein